MKEEWYDKTERYIRGELSDAERQAFEKELSSNSELQAFYESQKNIVAGVFYAAEKKMPGDYLIEEQVRRVDRKVRERERRQFLFKVGTATLFLGLIIGLAGGYWWWGEEKSEEVGTVDSKKTPIAGSGEDVVISSIPVWSVSQTSTKERVDSLRLERHEFDYDEPQYFLQKDELKLFTDDPYFFEATDFGLILSENYGPVLRVENRFYRVPYKEEPGVLKQIKEDRAIQELKALE